MLVWVFSREAVRHRSSEEKVDDVFVFRRENLNNLLC